MLKQRPSHTPSRATTRSSCNEEWKSAAVGARSRDRGIGGMAMVATVSSRAWAEPITALTNR